MHKIILPIILLILLFFPFQVLSEGKQSLNQPINFNHKLHLAKDIECIFCHEGAEEQKNAGKPGVEICESCHFKEQKGSSEEKKLRKFIKNKQSLDWKRVFKIDLNVYFSHARHVTLGDIECDNCHKDVGEWVIPPPVDKYNITMDFCINCHKKNNISTGCNSCHR